MSVASVLNSQDQAFLKSLEEAFDRSNRDFARAYYLFATAKLSETYNSTEIYQKYPLLTSDTTFQTLKRLYDAHPDNEVIKRLFTSVLGTYIGSQLSQLSDEYENVKNQLKVDVSGLELTNAEAQALTELLYEDVSEWLKKLESKATREELYQRTLQAYNEHLKERYIVLFEKDNVLLAELGYPHVVDFYSQTSGHDLRALSETGKRLVEETQEIYYQRMAEYYKQRTGHDFSEATRADISYVLSGKPPEMAAIDARFPEENMVPLATRTFDLMGLNFSQIAQTVDFASQPDYQKEVVEKTENAQGGLRRILLDLAKREGKRSRAYVYPAQVPAEIYLSVKPEGGLDDYSAFFHESGHAQHFAYEDPDLGFALALMGNNTVTETYAYLFQNLFLNRHWLQHMAGLSAEEARQVVRRRALEDLYMLRRYASKMQFEVQLFEDVNTDRFRLDDKGAIYSRLLSEGTGFQYDATWTRDVDAGFYVADYFTAWSLEAQLREYLCQHFGKDDPEDWYQNPEAGAFLKSLWKDGNLTQQDLSARLGYNNPNDVGPLVRLMQRNLSE